MSGEDLDLEAMDQGTIYQRLQLAVDSLSLFCRICNTHSSCKAAAEAHERGNGHLEKVDSRTHRMTVIELGYPRSAHWCDFCGKDVHDVAAHVAGKGHCKAVKVESNAWSARLAVRLLCDELRRRDLAVPEWCPERLYLTQRGRNAARGCSATATAAGVDDRGLGGSMFRAAAGAGVADRQVDASAGAAVDRHVGDDAGAAGRHVSDDAGAAGRHVDAGAGAAAVGRHVDDDAGAADRQGDVLDGFVRASGRNANDVALAMGLGLDRELAQMSSGMKELAEVSSTVVDGLGALRSSVEMLMGNVRGRERFEREMLVTLNTLSEGMQSMAQQRSDFETNVVRSLDRVFQELEALRASRLQATVVLTEVGREQDQSG